MSLINFTKTPKHVLFYKIMLLSIVASIVLIQFESYRPEKRIWRLMLNKQAKLYEYKINNQSLVAYTRQCLKEYKNPSIFTTAKKPFYIYTKKKHINEIKLKYKVLFYAKDKGKNTALLFVR